MEQVHLLTVQRVLQHKVLELVILDMDLMVALARVVIMDLVEVVEQEELGQLE